MRKLLDKTAILRHNINVFKLTEMNYELHQQVKIRLGDKVIEKDGKTISTNEIGLVVEVNEIGTKVRFDNGMILTIQEIVRKNGGLDVIRRTESTDHRIILISRA